MSEKAFEVKVTLDGMGRIKDVNDKRSPASTAYDPDVELPLKGTHYGWDLSKYLDEGVDLRGCYASSPQVATNPKDEIDHLNTAGLMELELVKLDCGYWGAYKRLREYGVDGSMKPAEDEKALGPQRNFGLIIGKHVWLCEYIGGTPNSSDQKAANDETKAEFDKLNVKPGTTLLDKIIARGAGMKLLQYCAATYVPPAAMGGADAYKPDTMFVIFPDLHLPERWPDQPDDRDRYSDKSGPDPVKARAAMRTDLHRAQCPPGLKYRNPMDAAGQTRIQNHLKLIHEKCGGFDIDGKPKIDVDPASDAIPPFATETWYGKTGQFNYKQFLAEKAVLDRGFRADCTWFYGPRPQWGQRDLDNPELLGDATPAVDLVNFLRAVKETRKALKAPDGDKVQVIQLGDMYEMWVNHEFLYRLFPENTREPAEKPAAYTLIQTLARANAHDYQLRKDRMWTPESDPGDPLKYYSYNEWDEASMVKRHTTGSDRNGKKVAQIEAHLGDETLSALRGELALREQNVEAFVLPPPPNYGLYGQWVAPHSGDEVLAFSAKYHINPNINILSQGYSKAFMHLWNHDAAWVGTDDFRSKYYYETPRGYTEIRWNKIILDLLYDKLNVQTIYGNHDGYRGDAILNAGLGRAKVHHGWISHPGIWCEHSHRWDPYNRDGMAFGAGVTNLTYFLFKELTAKSVGSAQSTFVPEEQKSFIPGAALWFLLKHFGGAADWSEWIRQNGEFKGFGIYVSGHTHSGCIALVKFQPDHSASARKSARNTKDAAVQKASAVKESVSNKVSEWGSAVKSLNPFGK